MKNALHILKSRRGATMAEELCSLVLALILIAAVIAALASVSNIYTRSRTNSQGQMLADILLDKMAGEISAAQPDAENAPLVVGSYNGTTFTESSDPDTPPSGPAIAFSGKDWPVYIYKDESQELVMQYRMERPAGDTTMPAWRYDEKMYMGFTIEALTFTLHRGKSNYQIVEIHLTLSRGGVSVETVRWVECYNIIVEPITS